MHAKGQHVSLVFLCFFYTWFLTEHTVHGFTQACCSASSTEIYLHLTSWITVETSKITVECFHTQFFKYLLNTQDAHAFQLKHLPRSPASYLPFWIHKHLTWCSKPNINHAASRTRIKSNSWVSKYYNIQNEATQGAPLNTFMPRPVATIQTVSQN